MKANLDLIKKLIECWQIRIHAPTLVLYKFISDVDLKSKQNAVGLSLIGILLANQIPPYYTPPVSTGNVPPVTTLGSTLPIDITEEKFDDTIVRNLKNTHRNIYAAAAEVIGMLLNVKQQQHRSIQRLIEQLNAIFKWYQQQNMSDMYVTCIYSLQKHYPSIVDKTYVDNETILDVFLLNK
jgi:DNA-dependent protein kinase catalytic subunit